MTALCGHCYKGRLAVDINGDAFPCVFARAFPVGNVREGLSRLLGDDPISTFRLDQRQFLDESKVGLNEDCDPGPPCRPNCHPTSCDPSEWCNPQRRII